MSNCQFNAQQIGWLREAADKPLIGTQKENNAQLLRLRHFFNDSYEQYLELFATTTAAKYETDQQPFVEVHNISDPGTPARWGETAWSIKAELESKIISLKYGGNFSDWLNPEMQIYYENQDRKQRWLGYRGTPWVGVPQHYFVDIGSKGLKLSNASHFDTVWLGSLRLDLGMDLRRADKRLDNLTDIELKEREEYAKGNTNYRGAKWEPDSRNDTMGLALALSTEGDGSWQASAGLGYQRVSLDVLKPNLITGNVKPGGGRYYSEDYYYLNILRPQGMRWRDAEPIARAMAKWSREEIFIDGIGGRERRVEDDQKHRYHLKSAHLALQYTPPGTGFTPYAQIGYNERAPTSNEMYIIGPWGPWARFTTNPYLKPEKNLSFQIGANYQAKNWLTRNDQFNIGLGYYRNRIKNYIIYGPALLPDASYGEDLFTTGGELIAVSNANVNNLNAFIRNGLELNLHYKQPSFYVRLNATFPIRHDNKICSHLSPSGRSYQSVYNADGTVDYIPQGHSEKLCYSSWNWQEAGAIEPIRGSLTVAFTSDAGRWEMGGTAHYRGKQRAIYWFDTDILVNKTNSPKRSTGVLPENSSFLTGSLWPQTVKLDFFASYRFNDRLKLGVYLANATDQMDATTTTFGYNFHPGRTLTANLEYRF